MVLDGKNYVPTLAIRASEMNGLERLPAATRERMTPCILLAPWANSLTLKKAIDRAEKAFPRQNYFMDIDRDYEFTNLKSPPQQELMELLNPHNAFEAWCEFILKNTQAWPCIQTRKQREYDIRRQIERFQIEGRPYCLRIHMDRVPDNIGEVISAFASSGTADYAIILEGGWTQDALSLMARLDGIIGGPLQVIDATVPLVLSCTSMPKAFTDYDGGVSRVKFSNRELVNQIKQRRSNRTSIIYGDWGSTRPREPATISSRPLDRIDYPAGDLWCIARNKKENWNFKRAAEAIINSDEWDGDLNIWGEEMIKSTAISPILGIDSPQKNVAARVNIHLHRQSFYGISNLGGLNLDEDWED